jgi:ABC-type Zn uptake system ZnuABC Zn-binding protein ZnuA
MSRYFLRIPTLAACLLLGLTVASAQPETRKKPLVVSSASIFADMVRAIADTLVESVSIVPVGGDPHVYEPTPGDARLLVRADLILQNGLTFEGWIRELIDNSGTRAETVTVTEGIAPITAQGHANAVDPHAWMDPVNGLIYVRNITEALVRLLPAAEQYLRERSAAYATELKSLDEYIRQQIDRIPAERRVLITSHDAFQYFGRRYGLRLESVLGTSTDADVRTADLVRLNTVIRESLVPAVFIESTINPKLLEQVARDNGIRIGGKLFSDSLGEQGGPADSYTRMIRHNTDVIVEGLTGTPPTQPTDNGSGAKLLWIPAILIAFLLVVFIMKAIRRR